MKYLKSHIFLIFALVSILFSIESYFVFNKIVASYENKIVKNYTILLVTKTPIKKLNISNVSKIEPINIENNLKNMKSQLKNFDFSKIKQSLPYFYRLHLRKFPSPSELKQIETKLLSDPNVKRVESFRTNQNQVYNLLLIIKTITTIFMFIILFISMLLIIKQLEVWKLEHNERMYIMELFGAPFGIRSAVLLKLAIIDSLVSIFIIGLIIEFLSNSSIYNNLLNQLQITVHINILNDLLLFLGISLTISLIATFIVIFSKKDEVL